MTVSTRSKSLSSKSKSEASSSSKNQTYQNNNKSKPIPSIQKKSSKATKNKNQPSIQSNQQLAPHGTCSWCLSQPYYVDYHNDEWGTPLYDDKKVFEFLLLETFQAGLSWSLILRKRDNFRIAFHDYNVDKIAIMTSKDVQTLMENPGIVRNRLKIQAAITNAQQVIEMKNHGQGLADYFWKWVHYQPIVNTKQNPCVARTELSDLISKDMKKRGFKFVGSTVIYAHLQATGIVNDHCIQCPRYKQVGQLLKTKDELMTV